MPDKRHPGKEAAPKGAIQIDFMISLGLFFVVFAFIIFGMTSYFSNVKDTVDIVTLRTEALSLLRLAETDFHPSGWNGTGNISRIGLSSPAKRFRVYVNNSKSFYTDQTASVTDLGSEIVRLNLSQLGFRGHDFNSTVVYSSANVSIPYQRDTDNISFVASVNAFATTYFTVYVDDDSNFTGSSSSVSGLDNLSETITAPESVDVLQYNRIHRLNVSSYSAVKNSTLIRSDFSIRITDTDSGSVFMDYGAVVPRSLNIVSLDRMVLFQNSTGGIRKGRLLVRTW